MASRIKRAGALGALVAAVVVVAVVVSGSGSPHQLTATFQSATNLVAGARVTAGGVPVGTVGGISMQNGLADVRLDISDGRVWPLPQGTRAEIRWGGTVSYSNRYVELLPGPSGNPPLPDGARLPTADTVTPVEFDQLFNVFSTPARKSLGSLVDNSAATFGSRAGALHNGLVATPPALGSVSDVLHELGEDPLALETLVGTGAQTAQALRTQQPRLLDLVSGAATTFGTIAAHAQSTSSTLAKLPTALESARGMLSRLDPTLSQLNTLVGQLGPGAHQLHALATPLGAAITKLGVVAPQLNATLADVQRGAPQVTALLQSASPLLAQTKPALSSLTPMLACLRTYTPEFAGFITTWLSFGTYYDSIGHYARVFGQVIPLINDTPLLTPAQVVKLFANLGYSLIRPPGFGAHQTWLQPQCGAGTAGINPAQDPEATR